MNSNHRISWVDDFGTKVGIIKTSNNKKISVFQDSRGIWRSIGEATPHTEYWQRHLKSNGRRSGTTKIPIDGLK